MCQYVMWSFKLMYPLVFVRYPTALSLSLSHTHTHTHTVLLPGQDDEEEEPLPPEPFEYIEDDS